jgi:catechol-2,3-dioxygenase
MKVIQTAHVPTRKAGFRPREYAHIVFVTAQPEALIDWYCKVLGMEVVMRHELINFLTWDDSQDRLAIVNAPNAQPKQPDTAGLHHAAYQVASLKELVQQYRYLKSVGITPMRCMNHGVATSMYYADPDGNQIELTVEAFREVSELNRWLDSKAFDLNPVGIFLDPETLCRRVESGEPEAEILKPAPDHAHRLDEVLRGM